MGHGCGRCCGGSLIGARAAARAPERCDRAHRAAIGANLTIQGRGLDRPGPLGSRASPRTGRTRRCRRPTRRNRRAWRSAAARGRGAGSGIRSESARTTAASSRVSPAFSPRATGVRAFFAMSAATIRQSGSRLTAAPPGRRPSGRASRRAGSFRPSIESRRSSGGALHLVEGRLTALAGEVDGAIHDHLRRVEPVEAAGAVRRTQLARTGVPLLALRERGLANGSFQPSRSQ